MVVLNVDHLLVERPDRLQLFRFEELVSRPPAPWLIRGVLRQQSVSLLYGRRGCFKSFVALDLAASLATDQPWQGHDIVTGGLVIYVAGEGGGGMVQRARAWSEQHQIAPRNINVRFVTEPVVVTATSDDVNVLIQRIRDAIGWEPEGSIDEDTGHTYEHETAREWPVLIVVDTLARCFVGDENKQQDMGEFIQGIDLLKREFNCSVLVVHHTGRDESHERGATSLGGACDTMYRLDADNDEHTLTLTNEKMKDSREPSPIELAYREVTVTRRPADDPDEDLTSVIIERADVGTDERVVLLLALLAQTGGLSWTDWFGISGLSKVTFNRYIVRLRKTKQIVKENGIWRSI